MRNSRERRQKRVRAKISGTKGCPHLSVFRSNYYISAQIIDDQKRKTLLGVHEKNLSLTKKLTKKERAGALGEYLAKKAQKQGIKRVVFDRGGYRYHGRVKALVEGARKGGLEF